MVITIKGDWFRPMYNGHWMRQARSQLNCRIHRDDRTMKIRMNGKTVYHRIIRSSKQESTYYIGFANDNKHTK